MPIFSPSPATPKIFPYQYEIQNSLSVDSYKLNNFSWCICPVHLEVSNLIQNCATEFRDLRVIKNQYWFCHFLSTAGLTGTSFIRKSLITGE